VASALKRPILGYGYMGFFRGFQGENSGVSLATHSVIVHSHNGLLQIWIDLGVLGVALVVYCFLQAFKDASHCLLIRKSRYFRWCVCIVCLMAVYSFDEPPLMSANNLPWMLFMAACIGLSEGARRLRLGFDNE
jgi:O-antigen ligase